MKNMNYSSQSIILAFSALLTTLWTLRERQKESSLKARSTSYNVHFLFFPYSLSDMQNGGRWRNLVSR